MEGIEPLLLEWAEDICEVCGAHVGYGVRLFHLGRCDEHAKSCDEESPQSPSNHVYSSGNAGSNAKRGKRGNHIR